MRNAAQIRLVSFYDEKPNDWQPNQDLPSAEDAARDIDAILDAFRLHSVRRYFNQIHWTEESISATAGDRVEPGLKLENVAAHSWHVADATLLLAGHFPTINSSQALALAVLHDKLEMYTGDFDPVGPDGDGTNSHAFCSARRVEKLDKERLALAQYLESLRSSVRGEQASLFRELLEGTSDEVHFVKAVDKLQALAFVYLKKAGNFSDQHLDFTLRYSHKIVSYFPSLSAHYDQLIGRLLVSVAATRQCSIDDVCSNIAGMRHLNGDLNSTT